MTQVTLTTLGRLVILHRDDPSPDEVRRRITDWESRTF